MESQGRILCVKLDVPDIKNWVTEGTLENNWLFFFYLTWQKSTLTPICVLKDFKP